MDSDSELRKTFKVELIHGDVIRIETDLVYKDPDLNTRQSELVVEDILNIMDKEPDKEFKALAVVSERSTTNYLSGKSRVLYSTIIADNERIKKIAVVTDSKIIVNIARLMVAAIGWKLKYRVFGTEKEALEWLSD